MSSSNVRVSRAAGRAIVAVLLLGLAIGCGSVTPLKMEDGAAGSGQGGQGGDGAAGAGGSVPVGFCNTFADCELRSGCCGLGCYAKTDPTLPNYPVCATACIAPGPDPVTCGCVNHLCSRASSCVLPGAGACPSCPNGYLSGPDGCQTCQCKPTDGGVDGKTSDAGSPGSVTLRVVIPATHAFCDETSNCAGPAHITILDSTGKAVGTGVPSCATICSAACTPSLCPGIACIQQGIAVKTTELQWDGSSYAASTCGNQVTCYQRGFAPAGHYVARMCATPGNLTTADGGFQPTCTATGPIECVEVPFDFPGPSPVVGQLP